MQGYRNPKFPNIFVREDCIENVQTIKRPVSDPYSVEPTFANSIHGQFFFYFKLLNIINFNFKFKKINIIFLIIFKNNLYFDLKI